MCKKFGSVGVVGGEGEKHWSTSVIVLRAMAVDITAPQKISAMAG